MNIYDINKQMQIEKDRHDKEINDLSIRKQDEYMKHNVKMLYLQNLKQKAQVHIKNKRNVFRILNEVLEKFL